MKYLIMSLTALLFLASCSDSRSRQLGDEEYRSATGAAATVGEVSTAISQDKPYEAQILDSAKGNLDKALQTDKAQPAELGAPLVQAEAIKRNPEAAAVNAQQEAAVRDEKVAEEQAKGFWGSLVEWGGWGILAGGGLWVARLLNVPGVQYLSDPLVKKLGKPWIDRIEAKEKEASAQIQGLAATVEGSVVGRYGLRALDDLLGTDVKNKIAELSNGEASTAEELFVWLAKSHNTDNKDTDSKQVSDILKTIKDKMVTEGGLPPLVTNILGSVIK